MRGACRTLLLSVASVCAFVLGGPEPATAHEIGVSRSTFSVDTERRDRVHVEFALARGDALSLAPEADADADGALSDAELPGVRPTVTAMIAELRLSQGAAPCPGELESLTLADSDGLTARARFACAAPVTTVEVQADFLDRLAPGHRHLMTTRDNPGPQLLHGKERRAVVDLSEAGPSAGPAQPFLLGAIIGLGVEHIVTGFDHLVFLLGLMLVGGRLRTLLGIISAFTLAHSLTLAAAATGLLTPPPALVEAAIAGSILYVGLENLFVREPRHRWRLTFLFGLIHGFGFAGVLAEIGLKDHLVPTLLGFNLGVELGQLAVLAVALPLLLWARRSEGFRLHGVRLASLAVAVAGALWLAQRTGVL